MKTYSARELLGFAHAANPPEHCEPGECETMSWTLSNGWTVAISYDCGELDYIDHFLSPAGDRIDFWDWPEEHAGRDLLIAWRGVEDTERLLQLA